MEGNPDDIFLTECPFCFYKYYYEKEYLGRLMFCKACCKSFEAKDVQAIAVHTDSISCSHSQDPISCSHSQDPRNTFLTQCPHCLKTWQFCIQYLNLKLPCANCMEQFEAHEWKKDVGPSSLALESSEPRAGNNSENSGGHGRKYAKKMKRNMADKKTSNKKMGAEESKDIYVPDSEFHEFAVDTNLFQANQIWALYAPVDNMPRWYAFIEKVLGPGFNVKIRWLDIDCKNELPVASLACGKFRLGESEVMTDHLQFSHQMYTKGICRSSVLVYPRKGETWAIYQNRANTIEVYEFVEVLSDFVEGVDIEVCYLGKIEGFVSLFQRTEQHGVVLFPPTELYRFSHQIPSFKMTGNEGEGVPPGSFELDPASLPTIIFD